MNEKVSVNTDIPSPYIKNKGGLYRMKRKLTYAFAFRLLNMYRNKLQELQLPEIGTKSGFSLDFAHEQFPNARFSGVEYDQRLMAETASRAPYANLIQGNAENSDLGRGRYDLVVSFQVIEHLYNLGTLLEKLRNHLKPGGISLVTTPNLSGLGARRMKDKWHGYRDGHVSLKGKDEWDRLIMAHGFNPLYSGSTFFSGVPVFKKLPLGIVNWLLLVGFGSLRWSAGESYVGVFKSKH